jgi:hypothetical protein
MKKKRYLVTLDYYIYADTDEKSKRIAADDAAEMRNKKDNKAGIISIQSAPYGVLQSEARVIHEGNLTIMNGEIIGT